MSDQDKPAGEQDAVQKIMQHAMSHTGRFLNEFTVSEIINAALAAEREIRESDGGISPETRHKLAAERERAEKVYADCAEQIVELEAKLATEREHYGALELEHDRMAGYAMESVSKLEAAVSEIQQLREQLAAERKEVEGLRGSREFLLEERTKIEQQLAAEREQVATLVDALKNVADGLRGQRGGCFNCDSAVSYIDAALDADKQLRKGSSLEASHQTFNELVHDNQQLREQLAADRDKLEAVIDEEIAKNNLLREQLATAVEALKFYAQDRGYGSIHERACAALAKIGEK